LFKKKFFTELICVSPIPSIFNKSFNLISSERLRKFSENFNVLAINFAFSNPICLIPRE